MYMLKYQRIPPRTPTSETPWIIVSEYYRLFRNGCKVSQPIQLASTSKDTIHDNCHVQMDFLHKVMAPDVRINSGFGVDAIVQEWLAVPEANRNITVRLLQLEYDERSAMMATIQSCIIITEHMLRCEFPYFGDNQGSQVPPLGKKLLGQSLVISTTVRFEWDSSTGRVLSMHYESDLVTPFLKLLGNLQDTAQVLDKSLLSIATCS
ncbi:hypothetical protein PHMEG_00018749 [Phytophthora megakarya]|uniref:Bzip transcription factor n=1 Tax=Phytophthora megakarya TaxID=4795 RepID=A0A225VTM8_9STRA|nr:hypothetical protein PHMEG_00018749 [Phytophthora megakarya]